MRALLAFDKFKDCLTSGEACQAASAGLRRVRPDVVAEVCPIADGGEGFAAILTEAAGGELRKVTARGPRGLPVAAHFGVVPGAHVPTAARTRLGIDGASRVALIEMASASGLALVPRAERDVWLADSFGTGELLAAAADAGVDAIVLGVGGSATSDLGVGALVALGLQLRSAAGEVTDPAPTHWPQVATLAGALRPLPPIYIACDVSNPLLGATGAAAVYGPQKGLRDDAVVQLDQSAGRLAHLLCAHAKKPTSLIDEPGAGAAGGISFGLRAAYGATLVPGFEFVTEWLDLERKIATADVVLTGEGRFDDSSLHGKGPAAIAARAAAAGKPVHIFAGAVAAEPPPPVRAYAVTPPGTALEVALRDCRQNIEATVARVFGAGAP